MTWEQEFKVTAREVRKEVNKIKRETSKNEWRKRGAKVINS
jgi:hypothetical protein